MRLHRLHWLPIGCCFAMALAVAQEPRKPLTNDDVIGMVHVRIAERTILFDIKHSRTQFNTSPSQLIQLTEKRVPETVLRAMIAASEAQGSGRTLARFSGSTVLVKYVAGDQSQWRGSLGKLGCLVTDPNHQNLIFIHYRKQSWLRRSYGFTLHLMDPSWEKDGQCPVQDSDHDVASPGSPDVEEIPFAQIKTLARGHVLGMGQAEAGALQWLTTVAGVGGVITTLTSSVALATKIGIGGGAGAVALVGVGTYLNRRTNNYISILYNERPKPKLAVQSKVVTRKSSEPSGNTPASEAVTVEVTKARKPAPLFCKCRDFAVFQVIDPHDYWNASMFLNAMTGLTFVDQAAAQGSTSGGSGGLSPSK